MNQRDAVLEIFLEKVRRDYARDVSLVFTYGSTVSGTAHEKSDIDLVFIPQTRRGNELAMSFLVGDIGYDFFPMSWSRLERIASFEEPLSAVVSESKVVWTASREHEERFEQLRGWIMDALDAPLSLPTLDRAGERIREAMEHAAAMQLAEDLGRIRQSAGGVLNALMDAVCLMNNRIFRRSSSSRMEELRAMRQLPDGFETMCMDVMQGKTAATLRKAAWALLGAVRAQYEGMEARMRRPELASDILPGTYEESWCNWWHKIARACAAGDVPGAFLAGISYQAFLDEIAQRSGMARMDIMGRFAPDDLPAFAAAVQGVLADYRQEMIDQHIPLKEFASADAYRAFLLENA